MYKKEFHDIFQEESGEPEFATLLKKMKVVDEQGESAMDEDQWDAASMSKFTAQSSLNIHIDRRLSGLCFREALNTRVSRFNLFLAYSYNIDILSSSLLDHCNLQHNLASKRPYYHPSATNFAPSTVIWLVLPLPPTIRHSDSVIR